jgi:hypothetical protein
MRMPASQVSDFPKERDSIENVCLPFKIKYSSDHREGSIRLESRALEVDDTGPTMFSAYPINLWGQTEIILVHIFLSFPKI